MTPYDNHPPASPQAGESGSHGALPLKRSGSQNRQRRYKIAIACDELEYRVIGEMAQTAGLSRSSYSRAAVLGSPGPRAQRTPPVNALELAKATAALNKVGSNINQIAHVLNAGGSIGIGHECLAALIEIREAVRTMIDAAGRGKRHVKQGQPAQ